MPVDLWGEPIPEPPDPKPQIGAHPLPIPSNAALYLRKKWDRMEGEGRLQERNTDIRRWLDDENRRRRAREREHARWAAGNPMLAIHGPGPDGAKCQTCCHLFSKRYAGTYFKCELRGNTGGPATDHRARWPACGRYEPRPAGEGMQECGPW